MARYALLMLGLLINFSVIATTSSKKIIKFDHYQTTNGLVSNRIFDIKQDKRSFLWIATDFGLERFDGHHFKLYSKKDYPGLWRNDIMFIDYDGNNTLTVGGYNGFVMDYDIVRDSFIDIMPPSFETENYHEIKGIYINEAGTRYIYANCGIYRQDKKEGEFKSIFDPLPQIKSGIIESMCQDKIGRYWLVSVNELAVYTKEGKFFTRYEVDKNQCGFKSNILPMGDGKFAVSLYDMELWIFDGNATTIGTPQSIKLPFGGIITMLTDKKGRTWFATDGYGLWYTEGKISNDSHFVQVLPHNASADEIIKIYALTEDKNGGIWLGTQNSGIWHISAQEAAIQFSADYGFPKSVCSGFVEDKQGNIIVGSDGYGLYRLKSDGSYIHYPQPYNNITQICKTPNGEYFASTWGGGIVKVNEANGTSSTINFNGIGNTSTSFFSIDAMSNGEVWACPGNDDIYRRNTKGQWERMVLGYDSLSKEPNKWIIKAVEGQNGTRWIITTNSIWKLNGTTKKALVPDLAYVHSHNPLSINDGVCDKSGNFYIATNKGIVCYEANSTKGDTLSYVPLTNYQSIVIDHQGMLWAAGDDGIIAIDSKTKKYYILPGDYSDLAKSYFFKNAGYVDSKGEVFFGTNGGFFRFDPVKVLKADNIGYFGFADLYISQQKVQVGTNELEDGPLNELKEIELAYGRTDISIGIDLADIDGLSQANISYRLTGLNNEWQPVGDDNNIKFNYLPTGTYQLEVKVEKMGTQATSKIITLTIRVLPPWWASWWFRLLMVVLLGALVYYAYKHRVESIKQQSEELKRKVDEQTIALRKTILEKDRLIAVIAHDLKSPMFGIVGALENWLCKYKDSQEEHGQALVDKTYHSANRLQNVLSELVDWARQKEQGMECQPTDINLQKLTKNICELQQSRANNKNISLATDFNYAHLCYCDERMASTVIRNLLSNAIKFSNRGGQLTLKGWEENGNCYWQIEDQGIGMSTEQVAKFNKQHHCDSTKGTESESGTGLGLSLCYDYITRNKGLLTLESEQGKGTIITFSLPMGNEIVATEEIPIENSTNKTEETPATTTDMELLQGNTVLIVDDDELIIENTDTYLRPYMQVVTAKNGKEALQVLEQNNIDLIVSDVDMPEMNGIEFSQKVTESGKHIPFLFVSAKNEEDDRLTGLQSGAIDYIAKPFSSRELLLKLSNILLIRQKGQKSALATKLENMAGKVTGAKAEDEPLNPFIEKFLALLEKNHSNNMLNVEQIASDMAVSQSTLGRKLKSLVGKTAIDMLTEYRLNKALQLLKEKKEDIQISDIAYQVGFSDPSYFSKKFKDHFGKTPTEMMQLDNSN